MEPDGTAPPDSTPATGAGGFAAGQMVGGGRFQLVSQLGRGGMGVVWLARDLRLDELLALKFLPPGIGHDDAALDDMRREVLKSRKLTHANIIRIHDFHEFPGEPPFISMEYVDGKDLNTLRVERGGRVFTWEEIAPLVAQLCDALDYAHGERVVHRDLKPGNMMIDGRGRLKLADFGIAATIADSTSSTSLRSLSGGTLVYMSPQQMDGELPQPSDDLYALGATIYELLTSQPPFHSGDIAHQVRHLPAKPMAQKLAELGLRNEFPGSVATMVMACLAKEPEQRPSSALAAAEWVGLKPITTGSEAAAVNFSAPQRRTNRSLFGATAIATILLLGAGVWRFTHREAEPLDDDSSATGTLAAAPRKRMLAPGSPGSVDASFDASKAGFRGVRVFAVQADGKIIVAGNLDFLGPQPRIVRRLNPDGSPDPAFKPARTDRAVHALVAEPGGSVIVAGDFEKIANANRMRIARLEPDGSVSPTFRPALDGGVVTAMARQPDGRVLIGGTFSKTRGQTVNRMARFDPDSQLDDSFNRAPVAGNHQVRSLALQPDGKILVGGWKRTKTAKGFKHGPGIIVRLLPNGTLDEAFSPGTPDGPVHVVLPQPGGKVMVAGTFDEIGGVARQRLARLNADGSVDTTFVAALEPVGTMLRSLDSQPDGRIITTHKFASEQASPQNSLVRLLPDGKADPTFDSGGGPDGFIYQVTTLPDGRILVAGEYMHFNGTLANGLVRLHGVQIPMARPALARVAPMPTNTVVKTAPSRTPPTGTWLRLFDGVSLGGWDGDPQYWSVQTGAIVGQFARGTDLKTPSCLIWRGGPVRDFELRLNVRYGGGNSGVYYRARDLGDRSVGGYQCDIFKDRTCNLLDNGSDRSRRDLFRIPQGRYGVTPVLDGTSWNEFIIRAEGPRLQHFFNGRLIAEVTDPNHARNEDGVIALELAGTAATRIEFKEIHLRHLPRINASGK